MIVTLTAHPSLDRAVVLPSPLRPGEVQAATSTREDAGGKGINVSRVVSSAGVPSRAVLPLAADDPFERALRAAGVDAVRVPVRGHVRANLTLTDPAGVTTKINLPGARLDDAELAAVVAATVAAARGATWLVLAGSLPPGAAAGFYVDVIAAVRAALGAGAPRIAVDTSGEALRAVVAGGAPDLIKPNEHELGELSGIELDPATPLADDVLRIARHLVPGRVAAALVTLGAQGAVYVDAEGAWSAAPPPIRVVSTVGAGDSSLAGFLIADAAGEGPEGALVSAIRYGAAAASLPGTQAPGPGDLSTAEIPVTSLN